MYYIRIQYTGSEKNKMPKSKISKKKDDYNSNRHATKVKIL